MRILRWTALIFYMIGGLATLIVFAAAAVISAMEKQTSPLRALDDLTGFSGNAVAWSILLAVGAVLTLADVIRRFVEWCAKG